MFIIEQKYGNDGYSFWFKLLEQLGVSEGHSLDLNDKTTWTYLCARGRVSESVAGEILDLLADLEAIDSELWAVRIVWIQNFVDGISDVYTRFRHTKPPARPVSRALNPTVEGVSTQVNPQSKVKESKVKEREPRAREENAKEPGALSEHSFGKFKELMPLRSGKFLDEDACRIKWDRSPAVWAQWLLAARNYRASREVQEGAVCSPMTFLSRKFRDWLEPEQPLGHDPPAYDTAMAEMLDQERAQFQREQAAGALGPQGKKNSLPRMDTEASHG